MTRYWSVWREATGPTRILVVTLAVATAHLAGVLLGNVASLPQALAVPLAILLGPAGLWGAALGGAVAEATATGLSVYPLIAFVDVAVCGAVALALWRPLPSALRARRLLAIGAVVPVALIAVTVGAGVGLVLAAVLAGVGAAAILPAMTLERLPLAAVLAPAFVLLGLRRGMVALEGHPATSGRRWTASLVAIGAIGAAWLVGAALFSLVRRDFQSYPLLADAVGAMLPGPAEAALAVAVGEWGFVLFVAGGAIGVGLIVLVLRHHAVPGANPPRVAGR